GCGHSVHLLGAGIRKRQPVAARQLEKRSAEFLDQENNQGSSHDRAHQAQKKIWPCTRAPSDTEGLTFGTDERIPPDVGPHPTREHRDQADDPDDKANELEPYPQDPPRRDAGVSSHRQELIAGAAGCHLRKKMIQKAARVDALPESAETVEPAARRFLQPRFV